MTQTLQLEEAVQTPDAPQLLVEWSSPWHEFITSIGPALTRSDARLAGEAPFGLVPFRIMIPSYLLEAFLIFAAIIVQVKIEQMRPYVAPRFSSHDVIYYSGDELPRTEDLGGAQAGATGRAGGDEAHHRTQTIKIARGGSLVERVVDAPNLKLPSSRDAVANLLAIKPNAGPPPSEGLHSGRMIPNLATTVVAPAPNAIRDYTRNGIQLNSVIAPAPNVSREQPITAPTFSATPVPPAPSVADNHTLAAPALNPTVIAPAPTVSRDRTLIAPALVPSVVAPAPSAARDRSRTAPQLAANVIPPAPGSVSREVSSTPVQVTNAVVVPPPASAPERATTRTPKLSLPSPAVIAPPPSTDVSQDLHRLAGGSVPDTSRTVVPPPPTQSGGGSFMSSLMGKIFGATEVVPPPPSVNGSNASGTGTTLTANIVPPPPAVATSAGGSPRGTRNGMSAALGNVVAPPPSVGLAGSSGTRAPGSSTAPKIGMPTVVPPPPSLSGAAGSGPSSGSVSTPGGTLLANNVVPPPPSVSGTSGPAGSGLGRKRTGLGAPLNVGSNITSPTNGGSGANSSAVISSQPGSKVGLPMNSSTGSLALSPSGGNNAGLGGAGGGTSIGHGNGPGSGMADAASGAGRTGTGHGSDPTAHGGISPTAGPGGAGNAPSGNTPVPGVSINGGNSIVTLPSFGSDPAANTPTAGASHSTLKPRGSFDVDVVATAGSGGAFEPYKNLLHGEKHTIYPETSSPAGTASMEYAADSTATGGTFVPPQPIRTTLPDTTPHARMVVICVLDAFGNLKNVRVLEPGPANMTAKVLAALRGWKFQPALRGDQPVEVTAIIGFGIDTNDRF